MAPLGRRIQGFSLDKARILALWPERRFLGRRPQRIQSGTTPEGIVKGLAEMAQAGVADFQSGFGDIESPGPE